MTAAWVTIAVLVLAVPVLAFWLGGRRFWGRLSPGAEADPWRETMHRLGLSPQEMAKVEAAGTWAVGSTSRICALRSWPGRSS
jgi:hypothetical protein